MLVLVLFLQLAIFLLGVYLSFLGISELLYNLEIILPYCLMQGTRLLDALRSLLNMQLEEAFHSVKELKESGKPNKLIWTGRGREAEDFQTLGI